ncbi:LOW QUALITY PROTEIN: hypothetical protein HJC23_008918 [Cyclotella cryptica]|uniref:dolichyl-P-Man:Man5GlcNAc2-PP-dolichol alpha-1,3-mannosyltransferase n=1 Tax=Cyclotella cryptica TaxID=29204 RepID=A0ABD3Q1F9_9STRA
MTRDTPTLHRNRLGGLHASYMQEVSAYQNGELDYVNIRGDTGPLVYPAGFLYLYSWLKSLASDAAAAVGKASMESGEDFLGLDGSTSPIALRKIQWVFVVMYLVNSAVVMALYQRVLSGMRQRQQQRDEQNLPFSALVWAWRIAMGITFLSKRIHSIFVLRLFNDAPAMLLLNLSMYLVACCDAWALGRVVFAFDQFECVMFTPGLLLLLLQRNGSLLRTIRHLAIYAVVQIVLGWPFLSTYPVSYIKKAFEFDRVFFFKWTVNWKFLPEELFVSTMWALVLLSCHLGTLAWLATKWWNASMTQRGRAKTREWMCWTSKNDSNNNSLLAKLSPEYLVYTFICPNASLSILLLVLTFPAAVALDFPTMGTDTSCSKMMAFSLIVSTIAIFGVKYAFNVYPATKTSSVVLEISVVVSNAVVRRVQWRGRMCRMGRGLLRG